MHDELELKKDIENTIKKISSYRDDFFNDTSLDQEQKNKRLSALTIIMDRLIDALKFFCD